MSDGAVAIYFSLATALAVWGTVALYLGRVGARLSALQRELGQSPPADPADRYEPREPRPEL
jgi:hypothetical protein